MIINHNIAALNTHRQLGAASGAQAKSMEKLASGLRINRAGDDAAGLAISEKMRAQVKGLDTASRNAQDAISLIQTAEGALNETHSILQRMRELAVQSSNDTNTASDRSEIQKEMDQLKSEVTRISTDTEFNTKKLLNGDMGKTFAVTANSFTPSNVQAIGSDITDGTYTFTVIDAGTETTTLSTNTAASGLAATDITVGVGNDFGDYRLSVTNFSAGTADLRLEGPDGKVIDVTGVSEDGAAVAIGGFTFDFSSNNITANGTIEFSVTQAGLEIDLSGAKTVDNSAITSYAGEKLNYGGFEFTVKTGAGLTDNNVFTMNVTDKAVKFHIGANAGQNTALAINNMSASALNIADIDVTNQSGANNAITTINDAIEKVSGERSKLGAIQNRLEHTINNLGTSSENLTAAESRIRDVDYTEAA
ncbi:flagellin [Lederbergia citrea]|uniref:flagellin N-terminal helical domain-containing protein n=1 Tax=Lederbergia citrea TaxID=2833581 RepID=UPI001BC92FE6|nr:flagellin [Lederbergia citrea]MBS4178282.1 flagellin [Lederbergia citrea]